jgi:hypothetical protein
MTSSEIVESSTSEKIRVSKQLVSSGKIESFSKEIHEITRNLSVAAAFIAAAMLIKQGKLKPDGFIPLEYIFWILNIFGLTLLVSNAYCVVRRSVVAVTIKEPTDDWGWFGWSFILAILLLFFTLSTSAIVIHVASGSVMYR